jgi:hypothetical protein
MDILNFISWIRGGRYITSIDSTKTLVPVAVKDDKRDDSYLACAITAQNLAASLDIDRLVAGTREVVLDSTGTLTLNTGDLTIKTDPLLGDNIFIRATDRVDVEGGDKLLNANDTGGGVRLLAGSGSDSDGFANAGNGGNIAIYAGGAGTSFAGNQGLGGNTSIRGGFTSTLLVAGGPVFIQGGSSVSGIEGNINIGGITTFRFDPNQRILIYPLAPLTDLGGPLPSAGARAMINDSTVTATGNFGAIAVGGGTEIVPVFSDGVNWLIG